MIEYSVLELFPPFLLGYCDCGCGQNLKTLKNHNKIITHFLSGHQVRTKDRRGFNHPQYKNGRMKDNGGYWRITVPGYRGVDDHNRIREHVYNFQEFNKCCLLPWGTIHHIDHNKENNMPWNLKGMVRGQHVQLHFREDDSNRRCFNCGSEKTYLEKSPKPEGMPRYHWRHLPWDKEHWYCSKCYDKLTRRRESFKSSVGGP